MPRDAEVRFKAVFPETEPASSEPGRHSPEISNHCAVRGTEKSLEHDLHGICTYKEV